MFFAFLDYCTKVTNLLEIILNIALWEFKIFFFFHYFFHEFEILYSS